MNGIRCVRCGTRCSLVPALGTVWSRPRLMRRNVARKLFRVVVVPDRAPSALRCFFAGGIHLIQTDQFRHSEPSDRDGTEVVNHESSSPEIDANGAHHDTCCV